MRFDLGIGASFLSATVLAAPVNSKGVTAQSGRDGHIRAITTMKLPNIQQRDDDNLVEPSAFAGYWGGGGHGSGHGSSHGGGGGTYSKSVIDLNLELYQRLTIC